MTDYVLMMFVFSWYECMILPYIGTVFAVFILKERTENGIKTGEVISKGIFHAAVLVLGVMFETVITKALIKIFSIEVNSFARTPANLSAQGYASFNQNSGLNGHMQTTGNTSAF